MIDGAEITASLPKINLLGEPPKATTEPPPPEPTRGRQRLIYQRPMSPGSARVTRPPRPLIETVAHCVS